MAVQPSLCLTWSEPPKAGFVVAMLMLCNNANCSVAMISVGILANGQNVVKRVEVVGKHAL